jgi:signal transduction histidine kinase
MNKLVDKLIVLLLCTACYLQYEAADTYLVVPVICAVAASALLSYAEKDGVTLAVFLLYCGACVAFPVMFFFMPLLCYDIAGTRFRFAGLVAAVPAIACFEGLTAAACVFVALIAVLSVVICYRTKSLEKARRETIRLRDTAKEFSMQLEGKNRELMEKQDYEVNLATLNERNRIARDIHDNVGHVLSNALLQTGALLATTEDGALREKLVTLKDTLSRGMDSIRESVHDLHDESVDLFSEAKTLVDNFRFCEISLDYGIEGNPEKKTKYALIAILKEALSNVARHSDARHVAVSLREHPGLYQLVIKDNGTKRTEGSEGIGLKNIERRVEALGGVVNAGFDRGFTVFASIPKEKTI